MSVWVGRFFVGPENPIDDKTLELSKAKTEAAEEVAPMCSVRKLPI